MSADRKKFYVTTPIYYVNARPHIGHAYTTIVADVLARRHRLLGDDTFFLTGTDEHGQKIERSAAAAGIPPQQFTDQVAAEFKTLWDRMGITYDKFIRTTSPEHARGVQQLWRTLEANGYIYLDSYTGSYCVSDEAFVDAPAGTPCPDCGRLLETVTEENYFFKLSAFQLPLLDLIESNTLIIENDARRNEVRSFLRGNTATASLQDAVILSEARSAESKEPESAEAAAVSNTFSTLNIRHTAAGTPYVPGALKDLSISRSSFKWGIPVPEESHARSGATAHHVVYVWLDALANYITALGYGSDNATNFEKFWPADLHLVGKEIIRFHCVYWPAFLLAAELPLPKAITAHGWLLFDNSKMSKSKGNIVRTETILDAFGTLCPPAPTTTNAVILSGARSAKSKDPDAAGISKTAENLSTNEPTPHDRDLFASDVLRYFLLREIPFGQDGSFSFDALLTRYNADLANGYGNLVSRTLSMIAQYFDGYLPTPSSQDRERLTGIITGVTAHQNNSRNAHDFSGLLETIWGMLASTDAYITRLAPWKLAKDPEKRKELADVLYNSAEFIRCYTALTYEYLPFAASKVWAQLGLGDIELAAKNGELKNLQWGGLKPGTKLGPLSPIFPRADKSLIEIMTNMEEQTAPTTAPIDPRPSALGPEPSFAPLAPGPPPSALATIDDFAKIELRVAQIVVAERIPKADKLLRLEVDLGPDFPRRQILSGIAEHYTPEELIGRRIVVITNLAPRKMRGLESHGMLLAASHGENGKPILATFAEDIALGSRLK